MTEQTHDLLPTPYWRVRCSLLALLVATCVAACAPTAQKVKPTLRFDPPSAEYPGLQVGRMEQWSAPLATGGEVEIINPYGDVYIRHNRGGVNVGISGVIQRLGQTPAIENIDLQSSDNRVRLEVSYPAGIDMTPDNFERPGRVDLAVLVPEGSTLRVRTRDGKITGKRIRANIDAESESGRIDLSSSGWMEARSDSGHVQIVLIGDKWDHQHKATTRSGSIAVEFPTKAPLSLHGSSAGTITVEPTALAEQLTLADNTLTGRWGNAPTRNRVDARSETGNIHFALYGWMHESVAGQPPDPSR